MLLTVVLVRGIRESAETNNVMVLLKIAAILAFVFAGMHYIHPSNYHPFAPQGWSGILTGGSIIFFTYIGFDSVSTAAEEARNPQRDLPIGIIATLIVCTVLYIAVAVVLTGIVPWQTLDRRRRPGGQQPQAARRLAPDLYGLHWVRLVVLFGAMMGMISSLLVFQLGQARVWFAMSRDGLLPKLFGRVHPRFRTPSTATWIAGFLVGIPGGILDIGTLADLSNIGTLFAFVLVSLGVIILRYKQPERRRGFRAPGGLAAPILSVLFCIVVDGGAADSDVDPLLCMARRSASRCTCSTAATAANSARKIAGARSELPTAQRNSFARCPRPSCICISRAQSTPRHWRS